MIQEFLGGLDAQLLAWVGHLLTALQTQWTGAGFLRAAIILAVVGYGYGILMGWVKSPIEDSIAKFLLITFVAVTLTFPVVIILDNVYPFFARGPFELAGLLPAAPPHLGGWGGLIDETTIYSRLDEVLETAFVTAGGMIAESGWTNPIPAILALMILIATLLMVGMGAFLIVVAKMAIALLVGLSPIFLISLLFKTTRGLFERWLGLLFNYSLIPILALALMSFGTQWMVRQLEVLVAMGSVPSVADAAIYTLAAIISFLLMLQIPQMAATIGGGLALSTMGAAGSVGSAARRQIQRIGGAKRGRDSDQDRKNREAQRDREKREQQNADRQTK